MANKKVNPLLSIVRQAAAEEMAQTDETTVQVNTPVETVETPAAPVVPVAEPDLDVKPVGPSAPVEKYGESQQVTELSAVQPDGADAIDPQSSAKRTRRLRKPVEPEPELDPDYDPNETVKISVGMSRVQADYIKNTSVGSGISLTEIGLAGMLWKCKQIEKELNAGQPYPPRKREPKKGRPIQ